MVPLRDGDGLWLTPASVALAYLLFGSGWIVLSDWAVTTAFGMSALTVQAQLAKGLLFVLGSGLFIYWLVARRDRLIRKREETIREERSEIRALESDVHETEELMEVVLGNIVDTVLLTDEDGRFTYVCPNVHFIFGYSSEEVRGMGSIDALLGERFPLDGYDDREVVENIEHEIVDTGGRDHTVLVTVKSVSVESGSVLYSVRDITERKEQEERFRAYVENSSDVITVLDEQRTIEYVSPSAERILGYDPDDLVGEDAVGLVHQDDRAGLVETLDAIDDRPPGTTFSEQYRTRHADGSWLWTESRLTTHEDPSVGTYVINTRDVSDLREREGRLSVLDRVLRHNIRNKLNVVLGAVEDVERASDPDATARLELVVDAAESLLSLSEKARRFDTSIRRNEATIEPVEIVSTARRVVEEKRAEYPQVEFLTRFPPEAWASTDEAFELALTELVDNAVHHSMEADPVVEVEVDVGETTVGISVSDRGPGLPEVDRRAVLKGEETQLEHGTGIGLWLVRWTVENSDGTLDVRDNAPNGTVIEIGLPRAAPPG